MLLHYVDIHQHVYVKYGKFAEKKGVRNSYDNIEVWL